jgi:hypothetical protein
MTSPNEEARQAAVSFLVGLTRELVLKLQAVVRSDASLRAKYIDTLALVGQYLAKIDAGYDVAKHVTDLAIALSDLDDGIVDPALDPGTKVKGDPSRVWRGRMWAALGMECLLKSGLTREKATQQAVARWPGLNCLLHGSGSGLRSSLLSWRDRFMNGEIRNSSARMAFKSVYGTLGLVDLVPEACDQRAQVCFSRAMHFADDLSAK